MSSPAVTVRLIVESQQDTGDVADKKLDIATILQGTGLTDYTPGRRLKLGAAAADQALTFTAGSLIIIVSRDNPFKVRLAAGGTLTGLLKIFAVVASDDDETALSTSVLLTGNGDTAAELEIWIVEALP